MSFFNSLSTGQGRHWFVVYRSSPDFVEVFDSLGSDIDFLKKYFKIRAIVEFNETPVQCEDSQLCGLFVTYFSILRYFNLDMEFFDFLNDIFNTNCKENERNVKNFLKIL